MSRKINAAIDLSLNEILNVLIQNLSSDPTGTESRIYYNTTSKVLKFYDGTTWVSLGSSSYSTENAQDDIASAFAAGTQSGLTITYDDANNKFSFTVTDAPLLQGQNGTYYLARANHTGTQLSTTISDFTEAAQDAIAAALTASATATWAYVDASNTIQVNVIDSPTLQGSNGAFYLNRANHTSTQLAATISDFNTAVRTNRLDQMAVPTASVDFNSQKIINLANGTASTDGVNLGQIQDLINTGTNKTSVRAASTGNVVVASALINSSTLDGVTLATGNRVLLKNQTTASENGIYIVAASGAASRATDTDISAEVKGGLSVWINEGTANGDTRWVLTTDDPITLGSTSLVFVQDFKATSTTAGAGLVVNGAALDVGQGTGIIVNANDVAIDTTVVVRKFTGSLTGGATSEVITHNLNTRGVLVRLYLSSGTFAEEDFEVEHTSVNTVTVRYSPGNIPTTTYNYVVVG